VGPSQGENHRNEGEGMDGKGVCARPYHVISLIFPHASVVGLVAFFLHTLGHVNLNP